MFGIRINSNKKIESPCTGRVRNLEKSTDSVFKEGILGEGCFIEPEDGKIYSPVNGVIETVFPTKHAIGLKTEDGLEILIHLGIDTVNLNGKYFDCEIESGDRVSKGQQLLEMDVNKIKKLGYKTDIYIFITNASSYDLKFENIDELICNGETLITYKIK